MTCNTHLVHIPEDIHNAVVKDDVPEEQAKESPKRASLGVNATLEPLLAPIVLHGQLLHREQHDVSALRLIFRCCSSAAGSITTTMHGVFVRVRSVVAHEIRLCARWCARVHASSDLNLRNANNKKTRSSYTHMHSLLPKVHNQECATPISSCDVFTYGGIFFIACHSLAVVWWRVYAFPCLFCRYGESSSGSGHIDLSSVVLLCYRAVFDLGLRMMASVSQTAARLMS